MAFYPKSVAYTRMFKMILASDHFSKATGVSPTVNISKAGAAFGAAAGAVAEVANGWYTVALTSADTGTAGQLAFYITAATADDTDFVDEVFDPAVVNLGVNAVQLGATAQTGRDVGASVLLSAGVGAGQLDFTAGVVKANATQWVGVAPNALIAGRVDANAQIVGDKTGYGIGVGGIASTAFAANAIDSAALATSAGQEIADEVLNRNLAGGASGGARIVRDALRVLRNKREKVGSTFNVYQEDDITVAYTGTAATTAGDPISSIDPT